MNPACVQSRHIITKVYPVHLGQLSLCNIYQLLLHNLEHMNQKVGKEMSTFVVIVTVLVITFEPGVSQPSNKTTNTNTPLTYYCGSNYAMSPIAFSRNLNSTFSQLRSQLSNTGVYYATAQSMENEDAVFGLAQCRNYLLSTECLACFDVAASVIEPRCGSANGAHVFLDNCFLRCV